MSQVYGCWLNWEMTRQRREKKPSHKTNNLQKKNVFSKGANEKSSIWNVLFNVWVFKLTENIVGSFMVLTYRRTRAQARFGCKKPHCECIFHIHEFFFLLKRMEVLINCIYSFTELNTSLAMNSGSLSLFVGVFFSPCALVGDSFDSHQ